MLPNITRSIDNQTIKFGQLIEYNIRNIFFEKSYTEFRGEASTRLFIKIKVEHISESAVGNAIEFVFIVCQVKVYQYILKQRC